MVPTNKAESQSNVDVLAFEDVKRLTDLVFIPSGYVVQLKNVNNEILWEDKRTTNLRGSREGEICYKVNFGRDTRCHYCTGIASLKDMKPVIKEDRSLIDGKWYKVISIPMVYKEIYAAIELIQEITVDKEKNQVFDFLRLKNSLIFNILRHDLPNYLHNVSFALEGLEKNHSSYDNNQQFVKIDKSNSDKAISILDELRDFGKLEDPIVKAIPVKFVPILKSTIDEVIQKFSEKDINITFDNKLPDENVTILANNLVSDIFLNILTNAIKNTPDSPVKIKISLTQEVDVQEYVKIKFEDNGSGIAPEIKEVLFDRRERVERGWKASNDSLGLGMAIIKSLVDLFGAEIHYSNRIEDDWRKGTVVVLHFPQVKSQVSA